MKLAGTAALLRQQRLLWAIGAAWTVAVATVGGLLLDREIDQYREQTAGNAQVRALALRDTLSLTFRQLTALPVNLSHNVAVQQLLSRDRVPDTAPLEEAERAKVREQLERDPAVASTGRLIEDAMRDFGSPLGFVADVRGSIVAAGIADPRVPPRLTAVSVRTREYFTEAMMRGSGSQFLLGVLSGVPGLYFSSRVERDGQVLGVAVVKQDAQNLNQLLNDADGGRVFVTDANSVIVLANRRADLQHRLPGQAALSPGDERALYGRLAEPIKWRVLVGNFGTRRALIVESGGERQALLSAPLGVWPFTVWVMAPLDDEPGLIKNAVAWSGAVWLAGSLLLWAFWRRQRLLQAAESARRELLEMAHALPLAVFRYHRPVEGPGRFSFIGRDPAPLIGLDAARLEAEPGAPWTLAGDGDAAPPTKPVEFSVRRADRLAWLEVNSTPQPDPDGGTVYNGYWLDVSGRRETEQRLAALFEYAPAGYLFFRRDQGITHCNPATLRLFGYAQEHQLLGRHVFLPPLAPEAQPNGQTSRALAIEMLRRHMGSAQRVQAKEWRFRRQDGTPFDAAVSVIALEWDGDPAFCAVIEDVTVRKQTQEAMRQARESAEAASQTKSNFLANMSHELRTPMNAIIGMTGLALEDGLPERQRGYVEKANGAARSLLKILNDILDMSKIEAGQLTLEEIEFKVEDVIDGMADVLGLRADEKGLELLFNASPDLPERLVGDPTRLRQLLVNLGGNAVKFTEAGEVVVGMEVQAQDEAGVTLHGWVRDTGPGLSEAAIARLFRPFTQADTSTTRRFGGTGLGLVISRQLAERMGGRLWVDSAPGSGSTFHFTARFGRAAGPPAERAWQAGELKGRRALLVDDNAAALDVLERALQSMGVVVDRAESGTEALQKADEAPDAYTWILLDWKMPDIDGIDCARRLVERYPHSQHRILIVTAFSNDEVRQAAQQVPLAGVLQKPVTPSTLYDNLVRSRPAAPTPAGASRARAQAENTVQSIERLRRRLSGRRVLLVEDHPLNQELACELLRRAGVDVVVAADGRQALDALAAEPASFDAVLMDCQMPVMDGYTATQTLRADPRWAALPVIAMTASALPEDRERALASGMNAHVTKPLDVERMLSTLAEWVAQRPLAQSIAPPESRGEGEADWPPACVAIDTADGLARCMGRADLYRRLLAGFREAKATLPAELSEALVNGDWSRAQRRTHDLKGLAGTIGAHELQSSSQRLHALVMARDIEATTSQLATVSTQLAQVMAEIDVLVPAA